MGSGSLRSTTGGNGRERAVRDVWKQKHFDDEQRLQQTKQLISNWKKLKETSLASLVTESWNQIVECLERLESLREWVKEAR